MGKNGLKILGFVASLAGFGLTLFSSWVDDKKLDNKVAEAVAEAVTTINNAE